MDNIIKTRIQCKRDTADNWSTNNFTLLAGEIGYETDSNRIKIGDGSKQWNELNYLNTSFLKSGEVDPTTSTACEWIGQLYINTLTQSVFISTSNTDPYNWEQVTNKDMKINILNDVGTGSLHQVFDSGNILNFNDKNPNATAADSTLTGDLIKGALGAYAISLGGKSIAMGKRSVAEGTTTIAKGAYSHAEGDNSVTLGDGSHAEGYITLAQGNYSHSEGRNTISKGVTSHAEGNQTTASGIASHAEGEVAEAAGYAAHAEGQNTSAIGSNSHAEGYTTIASGNQSHAEGYKTTASGVASHSEGSQTSAGKIASNIAISDSTNKTYTVVDGSKFSINYKYGICKEVNGVKEFYFDQGTITSISGNVITVDTFSEVVDPLCIFICESSTGSGESGGNESGGSETNPDTDITLGSISHAEGLKTLTMGYVSHAEGVETSALGEVSHAEGYMTLAQGNYSHSEGRNSIAKGEISHSEGSQTTASGTYSHAEGSQTTASSDGSHAEGLDTTASHIASHAEGYETIASGTSSHAEGHKTSAIESNSHAEGYTTIASGNQSHAEGYKTTASGVNSHAEGSQTTASSDSSHAEGYETIASGHYQHVQGKYNIEDTTHKYAHIVGNGTSDTSRSNAHTLDWNGNTWFAGDVENGIGDKLSEKADVTYVDKLIPKGEASGNPVTLTDHLEGVTVIDYKVYGNSVQDGTPSLDNPVEIQSVGDLVTDEEDEHYGKYKIPIIVHGKNLFNKDNVTDNKRVYIDGTLTAAENSSVSGFIKVKPNTIYSLTYNQSALLRTGFYDKDYVFCGYYGGDTANNAWFTTNATTVYVRITVPSNQINEVMLMEGMYETIPDYEPYSGGIYNIYADEPLRKLRDYADYVDFENQRIVRLIEVLDNTGEKTIDESFGIVDSPIYETIEAPPIIVPESSVINISVDTLISSSDIKVEYYLNTDGGNTLSKHVTRGEFNNMINKIENDVQNIKFDYIVLTDQVNGFDYIVQMRNGSLVSNSIISYITITTMPTKIIYSKNATTINTTGMVVSAVCQDGTITTITDYTCNRIGKVITVSYTSFNQVYTTTYSIDYAEELLIDFDYTENSDGTYTLNSWKGTLNGEESTKIVIPDNPSIIL